MTNAQYGKDIKGLLSRDGTLSDRPAVWKCAPVYPLILVICSDRMLTVLYCGVVFKSLAVRLEMSSGSFLKSVSESNLDKLYDLPEGIQDVMGLQALRPSAAVCKVMTIPDSNCIGIVTPDEHVPTGFHEILIYDMGLDCFVCWSLTSLCHSIGHIETMPAREINPFTALTRIRS